MSLTPYPTLRLKLTMPQALKLQFLPAIPGSNAAASAAAAQVAADAAQAAANTAVAATANKVDKSGDVMTGFLTLNADPNTNLQAATKHYVDIKVSSGGIPEAPSDGVLYGRLNAAWSAAQPLDADLTSLAAAAGTNTIYYRSAANTWSAVTVSTGLAFSGGNLTAIGGGGNVSTSGTPPTVGQYGKWVTATTIQGVAPATVLSDIGAQPAGSYQPLDTQLTALASVAGGADQLPYFTSASAATQTTLTAFARTLLDDTDAVTMRATLGAQAQGSYQPFDNDLTAIAALTGTNVIYYRSAPDTWTAVTIGTNLTFTGGTLAATGGGGGAPVGAEYITSTADATLTAERVLTDTATITWDRTTPGQIKASTAAGGGNVSNVGSPANGQLAQWTGLTTIQGVSLATAGIQPLDGDLTAIAALAGTNTIYYRSAADTWTAVTVGANLSFAAGTLNTAVTPQASDPELTAIAGLTSAADQVPYFTGSGTAALTTVTAAARTVLDDTTVGAMLTTLGGQPLDGDLTAIAALAGTNTIYYRSAADTWSPVVVSTGLSFSGGNLTSTVTSGAPVGAEYITSTTDATLTSERVLTDTATVTWDRTTAGQIKANAVGGGTATPVPPQGRLTLLIGAPIMPGTMSGRTTIYYTPYVGNQIVLFNGTSMVPTTFTELSVATTDTTKSPAAIGASKVNDWFVWNDAGTIRLGHGPDWTNDTSRSAGTALFMVNGILVNNIGITNGPAAQRGTYVGTTRSNASSQLDWIYGGIAASGTAGFFGVWNCYNRISVMTFVGDNTNSWSYNTAAWRAANASGSMRVSYVSGLAEDSFASEYHGILGASFNSAVGIGYDTTTAFSGTADFCNASGSSVVVIGKFATTSVGFHFMSAIEYAPGASTYYGTSGLSYAQTGLHFEGRL